MRYELRGANYQTGKEQSMTVTADNEAEARQIAKDHQLMLTYCAPLGVGTTLAKGDIICPNPNCGYRGKPVKKAQGSMLTFFVLCLFMLLPGLIYAVLYGGKDLICPHCGMKIRAEH